MTEVETSPTVAGDHESPTTRSGVQIAPWRRTAVGRVFKGLTVAGTGLALGVGADILNWMGGIPGVGIVVTAAALIGVGGLWAGLGASHLIRYGKRGSAVPLVSLAGLGGSALSAAVTYVLLLWDSNPFLIGLNLASMAASGLFTVVLLILGLVTVVRWLIPDSDDLDNEEAWP